MFNKRFAPRLAILVLASVLLSGCSLLNRKNVGGLQVITNDQPSSLFLDGEYLDKTPYIGKTIQPGNYTLRIEPDNPALARYETQIQIQKNLLTVITWKAGSKPETSGGVVYEMEKVRNGQTELSFVTIPDNAIVTIDDGEKQFSPLILPVEAGHHQFQVNLPSYETQRHTINALAGHRISVSVKLAKIDPDEVMPVTTTTQTATPAATITPASTSAVPAGTPSAVRRTPGVSSTAPTGPTVLIKPTNFYQNGQEVLRVRSQPSNSGAELGFAQVGELYSYGGTTQGGWLQILFDTQTGWVSGQYAELKE